MVSSMVLFTARDGLVAELRLDGLEMLQDFVGTWVVSRTAGRLM